MWKCVDERERERARVCECMCVRGCVHSREKKTHSIGLSRTNPSTQKSKNTQQHTHTHTHTHTHSHTNKLKDKYTQLPFMDLPTHPLPTPKPPNTQSGHFTFPLPRTNALKKTVMYRAIAYWNVLPSYLTLTRNKCDFKRKLKAERIRKEIRVD